MEGEIYKFIKVWISVFICLSYCYILSKITSKGIMRFIWVLPVICLFLALPLKLHSVHLGGTTAFFLCWLANFKLLLFAFGKGPLCSDPSISLLLYLAVACLPIKIQQNPNSHLNGHNKENPVPKNPRKGSLSSLNYTIKGLLFALLLRSYDYKHLIHPQIILVLYCFHVYFVIEIILAITATMAKAILGFELEPQFNEPYLSTSLQDFWGRRWNLMVTSILRPTVYEPILNFSRCFIDRRWAPLPAVLASFVVSALMHELIFYYLGRVKPTWEITLFFLLHGLCLVLEIILKKMFNSKFQLPRFVSGPLTVVFVITTVFWLFFPPLLRCKADIRAMEEYAAVGNFLTTLTKKYFLQTNDRDIS